MKPIKVKVTVEELTDKEWYGLHDVSVLINQDKRDIMEYVRMSNMSVRVLFSKYTVFSKFQYIQIAEYFQTQAVLTKERS